MFLSKNGLEGRAAQSNSPVDCCDRERPSARSRANRVLFGAPKESTSSEVLFSMKRTLRCMKSEAGLRPMKHGFAARMGTDASLHASAASASWKPQVSASCLLSANASLKNVHFFAFVCRTALTVLFIIEHGGLSNERHRATVC